MPQGDKRKYTGKQKRQAEHIEKGYEKRGMPESEAERRAWATVNAIHGGGEKRGGSGYGKPEDHEPMRRGGRKGGKAAGRKKTAAGKRAAKRGTSPKTAATRKTTSTRKKTAGRKKTSTRSTARKTSTKKR
jgi:hypothetical protein